MVGRPANGHRKRLDVHYMASGQNLDASTHRGRIKDVQNNRPMNMYRELIPKPKKYFFLFIINEIKISIFNK